MMEKHNKCDKLNIKYLMVYADIKYVIKQILYMLITL